MVFAVLEVDVRSLDRTWGVMGVGVVWGGIVGRGWEGLQQNCWHSLELVDWVGGRVCRCSARDRIVILEEDLRFLSAVWG